MSEFILEMEGIHKSFPGVHALKGVQLAVRPGTVHGVMGENGAGKSTLMKIAIGLYRQDAGTIRLRGKEVAFESVHDALTQGISMIHQEMSPLPYMTVAQNIFLGREMRTRLGLIDHRAIDRAVGEDPRGADASPCDPGRSWASSAWRRCSWWRSPRRSRARPT